MLKVLYMSGLDMMSAIWNSICLIIISVVLTSNKASYPETVAPVYNKSTPSFSLGLHFLVLPDRSEKGALICSKICLKKFKNKKKGQKWYMPDKKRSTMVYAR